MQLKNDLSNAPSKVCFYKDPLFNSSPKGGTTGSRRPLVLLFSGWNFGDIYFGRRFFSLTAFISKN